MRDATRIYHVGMALIKRGKYQIGYRQKLKKTCKNLIRLKIKDQRVKRNDG